MQKVVVCWSGGKDSCLALHRLRKQNIEVAALLSMVSNDHQRNHSHGLPLNQLKRQAEAFDIPIEFVDSSDNYRQQLVSALVNFKQAGIDSVAFGSLYSKADRHWNESVAREAGLEPLFPVWITESEANELYWEWLNAGYATVICRAREQIFDASFAGRLLTKELLEDFKEKGICVMGENGEYHTFVIDGPLFKERIAITDSETVLNEGLWSLDVRDCVLKKKDDKKHLLNPE